MAKSVVPALVITCVLAVSLTVCTACTTQKKVSRSDVESQISLQVTDSAGNRPDSVSCPGDLNAAVGATLDCEMNVKGTTYGVTVTVTGIDGDNAMLGFLQKPVPRESR